MSHSAQSHIRSTAWQMKAKWLTALALGCCWWNFGFTPIITGDSLGISLSSSVMAQAAAKISPKKIEAYAKAVLKIEPLRKKALQKVRKIVGGPLPHNICQNQQPQPKVNQICAEFLDQSAVIIRNHGLSINEFNDITQQSQSDMNLMGTIQDYMRQHLAP